jgi:response regulator RpfG family c-di-GMP phosphodiesterase
MKKLLIVDDNTQNLYMLETLLKTNGFEVVQAVNGSEALELARTAPPDLIISDILMPEMDGFSLCREWRSDELLKKIPFIFYTATYTDPKDERFALSLGADRFLVKPMEPDILMENVRQALETQRDHGKEDEQLQVEKKEEDYYREYSEVLIHKLEDKMAQLQEAHKRIFSLYQASNIIMTIKNTPEMIHQVLKTLVETAGYQQVDFFLFDEKNDKLYLMDAVGFSNETLTTFRENLVFDRGQAAGLVGLVAKTGETINIPDTTKDERWISLDQTIQSALFVPVQYERRMIGVLSLFSAASHDFNEEDERNIITLTNSLAIALENKTNQEQVQNQLQRLSALHNIDVAINCSMDLRATLNILLSHVMAQLKVDASDVVLFNWHSRSYEYMTGSGFNTLTIENFGSGRNVAEKAILERRTIHIARLTDQPVPASFINLWEKENFADYWGVPLIAKGVVKGVIEVYHRAPFTADADWVNYLETLAGQAAIAIDNSEMFEELQRSNYELRLAYDATIEGWSHALDLRDKETEGHAQRVTEMTLKLAASMGINNAELVHIRRGALLHDIGKVGVPDNILLKPGSLTEEEWEIMRMHPQYAYDMLASVTYLQKALDIPYCHHEKWDGTGYPRGLKKEQIPLAARLFAVVDVWDALSSDRPYRKAWQPEEVLGYIQDQAGKHFDPDVVELFIKILNQESNSSITNE